MPVLAAKLREFGHEVFDDWHAAGPEADDYWQKYEIARGHTYAEALEGWAAKHVFAFDLYHLNRVDTVVLMLPAGKSSHLELGYSIGLGKRGFILQDEREIKKLPEKWLWLAGMYEGEGSISHNKSQRSHNSMQLCITSTDYDVILKLRDISGIGRVQGPYTNKGSNLISAQKDGWKAKPAWRWAVYKRADILFVLRGIWNELSSRRKEQIESRLKMSNSSLDELFVSPGPFESRWDVMYQFTNLNGGCVCPDIDTLIKRLANVT